MPRVAYITCDTPAWYDIAERMRREADWQPVYWIADRPVMAMIRERFPDAVVHQRLEAYHLKPPEELANLAIEPLDEPFLNAMSEAQVIALKMTDVVDSVDAFDFNERRRFFRQRLQFWRAMLQALRPDVAVFGFSAHVVYDYAVYVLCRYYGIRTVMFEATFNFALLFPMEDPMVGCELIDEEYARLLGADDGGDVPLPALYDQYLARLRGKYEDALPWYMKQQFEAFPKDIVAKLYTGQPEQPQTPVGPQTETGEFASSLVSRLLARVQRRRR